MEEEKWLEVVDEDVSNYEVSNFGNIRNLRTGKMLTPCINDQGYLVVCLTSKGQKFTKSIHTLIAKTFLGDLSDRYVAYHIDRNKLNNRSDNISWGTRSYIIKRAYENKHRRAPKIKRLRVIETGEIFDSIEECSEAIGVNPATISKCLNYPDCYSNRDGYHFEPVD